MTSSDSQRTNADQKPSVKMSLKPQPIPQMSSPEAREAAARQPWLALRLPEELLENSSNFSQSQSQHHNHQRSCNGGGRSWAHDLRISDNSHSDSNPGQRKKGGCKAVNVTVTINGQHYNIPAKCDVRKSFSNRSFAQYYDRAAYAIIPLDPVQGLYLSVSEATKGRDGKYFVAMEKTRCSIDRRSNNTRHPLLAFASESVYRIVIHDISGKVVRHLMTSDSPDGSDCRLEAKCLFQQGNATVVARGNQSNTPNVKVEPGYPVASVQVQHHPVVVAPVPVSFTQSCLGTVTYAYNPGTYVATQYIPQGVPQQVVKLENHHNNNNNNNKRCREEEVEYDDGKRRCTEQIYNISSTSSDYSQALHESDSDYCSSGSSSPELEDLEIRSSESTESSDTYWSFNDPSVDDVQPNYAHLPQVSEPYYSQQQQPAYPFQQCMWSPEVRPQPTPAFNAHNGFFGPPMDDFGLGASMQMQPSYESVYVYTASKVF